MKNFFEDEDSCLSYTSEPIEYRNKSQQSNFYEWEEITRRYAVLSTSSRKKHGSAKEISSSCREPIDFFGPPPQSRNLDKDSQIL